MAPTRRKRWRRLFFFAGILAVLAACLAGPYFYLTRRAAHELRDAIAETDQVDPGWRVRELEAKRLVIPDEQNSGIDLINAHGLMPPQWPFWDFPATAEKEGMSENQLRELGASWDVPPPVLLTEVQA